VLTIDDSSALHFLPHPNFLILLHTAAFTVAVG
jgi:hypothetical protein